MIDNSFIDYFLGLSLGLIFIFVVIILVFYVLYVVSLWKLFKKAGKNGWEALIPFYNTFVLIEISELNWWYFLIILACNLINIEGLDTLLSVIRMIVYGFCFYNIAQKTNQNKKLYAILGLFFSNILVMILGLSSSIKWDSSVKVSKNGLIKDDDMNTKESSNNERYCLSCGKKLNSNDKFCTNCGKKIDE